MFESYDEGFEDGERKGKIVGLAIGKEQAARIALKFLRHEHEMWNDEEVSGKHLMLAAATALEELFRSEMISTDPSPEETKAWCSQNE